MDGQTDGQTDTTRWQYRPMLWHGTVKTGGTYNTQVRIILETLRYFPVLLAKINLPTTIISSGNQNLNEKVSAWTLYSQVERLE